MEMKLIEKHELALLLRDSWKLNCLENAGVDNWEGYYLATIDCGVDKYTDDEITEDYNEAD